MSPSQSGDPVLLYVMTGGASPAPGTVGVQNANYSFTAPNQSVQVLVNQSAYTGAFTITTACQTPAQAQGATGVATAAFASSATSNGPQAVLTVTSGPNGGNCVFNITGGANKAAALFVGNTETTGNISSKGTSR